LPALGTDFKLKERSATETLVFSMMFLERAGAAAEFFEAPLPLQGVLDDGVEIVESRGPAELRADAG
jgi:hypothetical protein